MILNLCTAALWLLLLTGLVLIIKSFKTEENG